MARRATIDRKTAETDIHVELDLDGSGTASVQTGVGFLDHMLTLLARHALFDLVVRSVGDRHIDDHHTVEDTGIGLGMALAQALGDKAGIHRYGHATLPMDETLVTTAVDLSGRFAFAWKVVIPAAKIGSFDSELGAEFWRALAANANMNYHALLHYGYNSHHILEAVFKSSSLSLRQAVALDPCRQGQIPSTKGVL